MGDRKDEVLSIHEQEQLIAHMTDFLPRLWFGVFRGLQKEGFGLKDSLELLKTYIIATCSTVDPR